MFIDLLDIGVAIERRTEICIIGAGAAGITLARRLLAAGHEVVLLESGGTDYEAGIADLNHGANVGMDYYPLADARLRFFGGTTAIWGGRCAELDPIDLERRPWVPDSGWPIGWQELSAYYDQARPLFDLPEWRPHMEDLAQNGLAVPAFDETRIRTPFWSFDARFNRFTFDSCADLRDHPRCTIITHATVTGIEATDNGRAVREVTARSFGAGRLTISADAVVLASGGMENARLLLASRSVMPNGLGNDHDNVGRYFMEHPHARGGRIVSGAAWQLLKLFGRRHRVEGRDVAALIAPSVEEQQRRRILNTSLTIVGRQPEDARQFLGMKVYGGLKHGVPPTRLGRMMWMGTKKLAAFAQRHIDPLRPWLLHRMGRLDVTLLVRAEQAPNRDSRIVLDRESDAMGMPRIRLDWRMSDLDKHSVAELATLLGEELGRLGLGRVEPASWLSRTDELWRTDPLVSSHPIGGYHHIGTTRMADDPRKGVTTRHGQVHGIDNLYVVGSSTFPTSGWANPTLTIVALALRTADHLSASLWKRRLMAERPHIRMAVGQ